MLLEALAVLPSLDRAWELLETLQCTDQRLGPYVSVGGEIM